MMKFKLFNTLLLVLGAWVLLSASANAGNILDDGNVKCRNINNDDIREECREKKWDKKTDDIGENDVMKNGRVRCRKIENDRLRKECYEQKFD